MANNYFSFKQFTIYQDKSAFKVGTDGVLLGACAEVEAAKKILDIGSGTGLIAIMAAQRCNAEIVAIEPDYESYLQVMSNVENCKWKNRINVENIRVQEFISIDTKFDLILTNPPFFTDSLKNPDMRIAASRHNDSLTTEELLKSVVRLLEEEGRFQLILPFVEGNIFIAGAQEYGLYCNSIIKIRPLPTSDVRRLILTFSKSRKRLTEKFLTIEKGKRHDYTDDYINLTSEFYMKF